jgi:hypothetical protein
MKLQINKKNVQDLEHFGLDIEDEINKMLSEELAKSIDMEILKKISNLHNKKIDKINRILQKINKSYE